MIAVKLEVYSNIICKYIIQSKRPTCWRLVFPDHQCNEDHRDMSTVLQSIFFFLKNKNGEFCLCSNSRKFNSVLLLSKSTASALGKIPMPSLPLLYWVGYSVFVCLLFYSYQMGMRPLDGFILFSCIY